MPPLPYKNVREAVMALLGGKARHGCACGAVQGRYASHLDNCASVTFHAFRDREAMPYFGQGPKERREASYDYAAQWFTREGMISDLIADAAEFPIEEAIAISNKMSDWELATAWVDTFGMNWEMHS